MAGANAPQAIAHPLCDRTCQPAFAICASGRSDRRRSKRPHGTTFASPGDAEVAHDFYTKASRKDGQYNVGLARSLAALGKPKDAETEIAFLADLFRTRLRGNPNDQEARLRLFRNPRPAPSIHRRRTSTSRRPGTSQRGRTLTTFGSAFRSLGLVTSGRQPRALAAVGAGVSCGPSQSRATADPARRPRSRGSLSRTRQRSSGPTPRKLHAGHRGRTCLRAPGDR